MITVTNHTDKSGAAADINKRIINLIEPVVNNSGFELYNVNLNAQNQTHRLQVFIDSEHGVSLENCETVSRKISLLLDVEDIISHSYTLEVSSPGIFRELHTEKELNKHLNKRIQIKCIKAGPDVPGLIYFGCLTATETEILSIIEEKTGKLIKINKNQIKKISLAPKL